MNTTYEIRTDSNGTPFAISTINGKFVAVVGPDEFVPLVLKSNERIKWTGPGRTSTWGLTDYPQIGRWSEAREPIICKSGWHTTITGQVQDWVQVEAWLVKVKGTNVVKGSKEVHEQILFVRRLHFDPAVFAQACADRAKIHAESAIESATKLTGVWRTTAVRSAVEDVTRAQSWAQSWATKALEWWKTKEAAAEAAVEAATEALIATQVAASLELAAMGVRVTQTTASAALSAERQWQNDWLMDHF